MSQAYDVLPSPDWAGTTTVSVASATSWEPRRWARTVFDVRSVPAWVKALFVVREVAVRLVGIPPAGRDVFAVSDVVDGAAIIDTDDAHLRFVAAVRPDQARGLVHVDTLVRFHNRRGRLYFVPVRLLHDAVTRAMLERAARRLAG